MNDSDQSAKKEEFYCKECGEKLKAPKKCFHCGAYQRFNWVEFFKSLSSATAFIIVIISVVSLMQTCQEKQNAKEAYKAAEQALEETKKAKIAAETAKEDAIRESKELVQNLELATKAALEKLSEETAIGSKAVKELKGRIDEEGSKLDLVSNKATALSKELKLLDKKIRFQKILYAARNDDKNSYNQLKKLAEDSSYIYHEEAKAQYRALQKDPSFIYENDKIGKLSTEDLEKLLRISKNDSLKKMAGFYYNIDPTQPYMKSFHIIYIAKRRTEIPLNKRLEFLISIISTDESLLASKVADFTFWELVGQKHDEWYDEDLTLEYWSENKDKY